MPSADTIELFRQKAQAVSAVVRQVPDLEQALAYAVELTQQQGGRVLAAPGLGEPVQDKLESLCRQAGLELASSDLRARARDMHTGLSWADWGVAETGTLILDSGDEDLRLATMLSQVHVALLPAGRLRPDMESLQDELAELVTRPGGFLAFITGPSRTADIERVLTIGVHGPAELHILILPDGRP